MADRILSLDTKEKYIKRRLLFIHLRAFGIYDKLLCGWLKCHNTIAFRINCIARRWSQAAKLLEIEMSTGT